MLNLTSLSFSVSIGVQIEDLTNKNHELSVKLEVALAKLEVVCFMTLRIFIMQIPVVCFIFFSPFFLVVV